MALAAGEHVSHGAAKDADSRLIVVLKSAPQTATVDTGSGTVTAAVTSTQVAAANADRIKIIMTNDSNETVYVAYGTAAVLNRGVRLNASGGSLVEENWTGAINVISTSGSKIVTFIEF